MGLGGGSRDVVAPVVGHVGLEEEAVGDVGEGSPELAEFVRSQRGWGWLGVRLTCGRGFAVGIAAVVAVGRCGMRGWFDLGGGVIIGFVVGVWAVAEDDGGGEAGLNLALGLADDAEETFEADGLGVGEIGGEVAGHGMLQWLGRRPNNTRTFCRSQED